MNVLDYDIKEKIKNEQKEMNVLDYNYKED